MSETAEQRDVRREFEDLVNMAPKELEESLATDESKEGGWQKGGGESVGHDSGRRIVRLRRTKVDVPMAVLAHELGPRSVAPRPFSD